MKRFQPILFLILATFGGGGVAAAQGEGSPPGTSAKPPPPVYEDLGKPSDSPADFTLRAPHQDKEGLFLRFQLGFAMNWDFETYDGTDERYSGAGFGFGFSLGGFVAPNLALGGELTTTFVPSPALTVGGEDKGTDTDIALTTLYFTANYYFQPVNMFVVAGVGLGTESETGLGPAVKLGIGKEWNIGSRWNLGFMFQTEYANMPNGGPADPNTRFNAITASLLMTVSKG